MHLFSNTRSPEHEPDGSKDKSWNQGEEAEFRCEQTLSALAEKSSESVRQRSTKKAANEGAYEILRNVINRFVTVFWVWSGTYSDTDIANSKRTKMVQLREEDGIRGLLENYPAQDNAV